MKSAGYGWIVVGMALGLAAYKLLKKDREDSNPWDVDSVLKACEKAADKVSESMRVDHQAPSAKLRY